MGAYGKPAVVTVGIYRRRKEKVYWAIITAIIIGTPGRITDHLSKGNFNPETIETLIHRRVRQIVGVWFHDKMAEIITSFRD